MITGDDPDLIRTVLLYIDERIRDPKGEDRMNDQHIKTDIRLRSDLMTDHENGMPCFPYGRPTPRGRGINGRRRYYDPCPLLVIEEFPGYRKDAVYERV